MKRVPEWWLLAGLLVGGCRGARVPVPLPPEPVVAAPPRRLASLATDSGTASATKPYLLLPTPFPAAPPPVSTTPPSQNKPAHWPFHELAWQKNRQAAAAPNTPPSPSKAVLSTPQEKGISGTAYLIAGDILVVAGLIIGLAIGGSTGLTVGLLLFVSGYLLLVRTWAGSWRGK